MLYPAGTQTPLAAASRPSTDRDRPLIVSVSMVVVELPVGAASGGEAIWQCLDEKIIEADRSRALHRNGLRVGLTGAGNLPVLLDALGKLTGRKTVYETHAAVPGNPIHLTLKENQPPRMVFTFDSDGSAKGADYPAGNNVLAVSCRLKEKDLSTILLTVVPQIRPSSGKKADDSANVRAEFQTDTEKEIFSFEQAAFSISMPAGAILVIGPSRESHRPSSVAHGLLVGSRSGVPFETVLLLIPKVVPASIR